MFAAYLPVCQSRAHSSAHSRADVVAPLFNVSYHIMLTYFVSITVPTADLKFYAFGYIQASKSVVNLDVAKQVNLNKSDWRLSMQ